MVDTKRQCCVVFILALIRPSAIPSGLSAGRLLFGEAGPCSSGLLGALGQLEPRPSPHLGTHNPCTQAPALTHSPSAFLFPPASEPVTPGFSPSSSTSPQPDLIKLSHKNPPRPISPPSHTHTHITPLLTMASRTLSKSIRSQLARQVAAPRVQQRTFAAAARGLVRAGAVSASKPALAPKQQVRGVKTIDFAGSKEDVYGKKSYPTSACRNISCGWICAASRTNPNDNTMME